MLRKYSANEILRQQKATLGRKLQNCEFCVNGKIGTPAKISDKDCTICNGKGKRLR